jgi:hypothetical protein
VHTAQERQRLGVAAVSAARSTRWLVASAELTT